MNIHLYTYMEIKIMLISLLMLPKFIIWFSQVFKLLVVNSVINTKITYVLDYYYYYY